MLTTSVKLTEVPRLQLKPQLQHTMEQRRWGKSVGEGHVRHWLLRISGVHIKFAATGDHQRDRNNTADQK